jgi:hypothetical protein
MSVRRSNSAQTLLVRLNSLDSTTLAPSVYAVLSKSCPNLLYFAVLALLFCSTVKMNHYRLLIHMLDMEVLSKPVMTLVLEPELFHFATKG